MQAGFGAGSPTSEHAHMLTARGSVEDDSSPASAPAGTPVGQPVSPAYAAAAMPRSRSAGVLPVSARRRAGRSLVRRTLSPYLTLIYGHSTTCALLP